MTWQCPRCMVTFRIGQSQRNCETFMCDNPRCTVRYQETFHGGRTTAGYCRPYVALHFVEQREPWRKHMKDRRDAT